ncbi:hypothetical protein KM043_004457 [Ampulex compressa]|nr:hypothetical protein KM043_004457 [Ampulex compressa]
MVLLCRRPLWAESRVFREGRLGDLISSWSILGNPSFSKEEEEGLGKMETEFQRCRTAKSRSWPFCSLRFVVDPCFTVSANEISGTESDERLGKRIFVITAIQTANKAPAPSISDGGIIANYAEFREIRRAECAFVILTVSG